MPAIRKEQKQQAEEWARKNFRYNTTKRLRSPIQPKARSTPTDRIKMHLATYDKSIAASNYIEPLANKTLEINNEAFSEILRLTKTLNSTAT